MLSRFKIRNRNRAIVDALYAGIVARSRTSELFAGFGIPDTVMGRYESLMIHVLLALSRCRNDAATAAPAQDLVDRFMTDIEDSIRQIGIGDVAVPKRMRKLAGMFYQRVDAYDAPLRNGDETALSAALTRLALAEAAPAESDPRALATYMIQTRAELDLVPTERILAGQLFAESDPA